MSINTLVNQIRNEEIVLPGIQRDFVWKENKICKLLDSVMRGYPLGIVLLWETYEDLQYRSFVKDYKNDNIYNYHDNKQGKKLKLVLDGQQRLQSLFVALGGTFEGTSLYFDVLSGRPSDNFAEERFDFSFSNPKGIQENNDYVKEQLAKPADKRDNDFSLSYCIRVSDLFEMSAYDKEKLKQSLSTELLLDEYDRYRLSINIARLDETLSKDESILKTSVIDENLPNGSPQRKPESDVLEIFVRTNTGGTKLTQSDLIFSMLKLNWKESAETLPEFIRTVNKGNSFDIDTDLVIRCLLAVSDLGTKFDVDLLRKKTNVSKVQDNFENCCKAIQSTIDFVQKDCWCQSGDLIGGSSTLVPFVYYLFHTQKHDIRNDQLVTLRKAFYLFAFSLPFSRYTTRMGNFIRNEMKAKLDKGDEEFPFSRALSWVAFWGKVNGYNETLLRTNPVLAMHLIQGLSGAKMQYERNSPEIDHIFPRSQLRSHKFDEAMINHFANLWILPLGKNRNKSDKHPGEYLADVDNKQLEEALIDRTLLDYSKYAEFIKDRSEKIITKVKNKIQFSDIDFKPS